MNENNWMLFIDLLDQIAKQKKISRVEIARKAELHPANVQRFFDCKYKVTLPLFLKIAGAVEVNFFFEDKESKTDLNLAMENAMEQLGRRVAKLPKN
jgi:hypothetical protein